MHPEQWQMPEEFIPERFNPSSPFYKKPDGKPRSPFSFIPFSCGPRSCPGNIFAIQMIKIFLIVTVLNWKWTIDESFILPGTPSFVIPSQDRLIGKID